MEEGKKYGVEVRALEELKNFQISLLKSSSARGLKMDYTEVVTLILQNEKQARGKICLGLGQLWVNLENGPAFQYPLNCIASVSITDKTVKVLFQFDAAGDFYTTIQFENETRLNNFIEMLPPISRPPVDELATSNSSSESSSDSARGATREHHSSDTDASNEDLAADLVEM